MIPQTLALGIPNGGDLLIIAVLVLVLFGAKKLPRFSQSLGRSMSEFRRAREEYDEAVFRTFRERPERETNRFIAFCSLIFVFSLAVLVFVLLRRFHIQRATPDFFQK